MKRKSLSLNIIFGVFILLLIKNSFCVQSCTFKSMQLESYSIIPLSQIYHFSADRSSAYQTELDANNSYILAGYQLEISKTQTNLTTSIKQFSTSLQIEYQIAYVSQQGGCVLVDSSRKIIAYQTNNNQFTQVQRFDHSGYQSLRTSQDCNIIQTIDNSSTTNIYIGSNIYSGDLPSAGTIFDNSFAFGFDGAGNLYKYQNEAFTIIETFVNGQTQEIPLNIILKKDSSFVILYSKSENGDYSLLVYNYETKSSILKKNWQASSLNQPTILKVQKGSAFKSLIFKDQEGIVYMVTWANNKMNDLGFFDSSQNKMFSEDAFISFYQEQVYSYLNKTVNVFNIYLPDQIYYLGSYNDVDYKQMAQSINSTIRQNNIKYLVAQGSHQCSADNNSTDNYTNTNSSQIKNQTTNSSDTISNQTIANITDTNTTETNTTDTNITDTNVTDTNTTEANTTETNTTQTNTTETNNTETNTTDSNSTQNDSEQQIINIINQNDDEGFIVLDSFGDYVQCPVGCLKCKDESTCNKCRLGYVIDTQNQCTPCNGCKTCQKQDPSHCLTCFTPYTLNTDTNTCEKEACSIQNCQICNIDGFCISCYDGYSLWQGQCIQCIQGCGVCTGNQKYCDSDSCDEGYVYLQNTQTELNECVQCTVGCLSCQTTNLDNCIGCSPGYYPSLDTNKFPPSNSCLKCIDYCDTCSDSLSCITCSLGYKSTSSKTKCVLKCSSTCLTCQQNLPDSCLSCTAGYIYNSTSKTCQASLACNEEMTCKSCPNGYALKNKLCFQCQVADTNCKDCLRSDVTKCGLCKPHYYLSLSDNLCKQCSTNCSNCFDLNSCSQCSEGSYLVKQYRQKYGYCESCQSPCLTCYNKKDVCLTCITGYTLNGRKCKGQINVGLKVQIDIPLQKSSIIGATFITTILSESSKVRKTQGKHLMLEKTTRGSTIFDSTITADQSSAEGISNALSNGFSSNTKVQGYNVISSSTSVNGLTTSSNLGLILGVSIPLFIIIVLIFAYVIFRKNKDIAQKRNSKIQMDSQKQIKNTQIGINSLQQKYSQKI